MLAGNAGKGGMIRHAGKDRAQPVLLNAKPKSFSKTSAGLLENEDLQTVAHSREVRWWTARGQTCLADDQDIVGRKIRRRFHLLSDDTEFSIRCASLFGVDNAIFALIFRGCGRGETSNSERSVCVHHC